jgi:colicin import membrane protein
MKQLLLALALFGVSLAARAQDDPGTAAERARLQSDRAAAEAAFKAEEKACYRKFAVTDCVNAAKARRRTTLADLRRQEISLNDAERKRKAAQRLHDSEERAAAQRQRDEGQRAKAAASQKQRETGAGDKAASRAAADAARPGKAAQRQEQIEKRQAEQNAARSRKAAEEVHNRERYEHKLAEAEERRAKREKKDAERKKPLAAPLPTPP